MSDATAWLWHRLHRPLDEVQATRAVLGVDEAAARNVLARLLLESDEARAVLDTAPHVIRVLRNQQGTVVRTEASIRGPVLWAATISHRAASGFQDDLYVCAMPVRDYDIAENRALAAALDELRRAGRQLDGIPADPPDPHHVAIRSRGRRAGTLGGHPRLRGVPQKRPSPRDLAKVRTGTARALYEPAVALLERIAEGPRLADLTRFVDRVNAAHHDLLRQVVTEVERCGAEVPGLRTWRGQLFSGHLRYLPPRERGAGLEAGVLLDDVVFALAPTAGHRPATTAGAGSPSGPGRRTVVVRELEDVRRVLIGGTAPAAVGAPG